MMKKTKTLILFSSLACLFYACGDDSSGDGGNGSGCSCLDAQVCAANGICYDNAECSKCTADQVCVSGTCYESSSACGKCEADQVCITDVCYDANSDCAKCKEGQICKNNKCFDANDPCAECRADQVCSNGRCTSKSEACSKCSEDQVCFDDACYEADHPCASCQTGESCINAKCVNTTEHTCGDDCTAPNYCDENGQCITCDNPCSDKCCADGQVCDGLLGECTAACDTDEQRSCGGICCEIGEICDELYICAPSCDAATQTVCNGQNAACCENATQECIDNECVPKCGGVRCGEAQICCEGNTPVCEDNVCKIACDGTRCGDDEDLCCDNTTEVCLYKTCLPRGKTCSTANDCSFDEFCEDTTHTCVKVNADPNACVVMPKPGNFEPKLQWHWPANQNGGKPTVHPEFDQVMNNPVVINLTDDNGDGKIDENDVPDLVFTTFSGSNSQYHYYGRNVLRVISGDDGRELATHPDIKFYVGNDIGAAKINDDEYPEIVTSIFGSDGKRHTLILNLVPKSGNAGYEFKEIADLAQDGQFPRFANLDGGKYPQIVTNSGIIEYVEDEAGNGKYQYRCSANFGTGNGGSTVADIDGDNEMEIVGNAIFDKTCKNISEDSISGGTVLADLDLVSDHENGRLDVEQLTMISGGAGDKSLDVPPPGSINAYKLFRNPETKKFRRELMWTVKMPIDYGRANDFLHQAYPYKNSDGSLFMCEKKTANDYSSSAAQTSPEYKEYRRRYMCMTGGGPLVIADFNGDKKPDVGLATAYSYVVYDGRGEIVWADFNTQDWSSKATGSSLFDFEGDGIAEVLYADEINLHIYKGPGSTVKDANGQCVKDSYGYCPAEKLITDIPNSSGTLIEYPLVVDVDNDNHSEIVVVSNNYAFKPFTGIRAFNDPEEHWVRTRRIWNQYDYHVTNINEDGTVPKHEEQNWKMPNLNNFRQNVQPDGLFNAPNLVAEGLSTDESACEKGILKLIAKIENKGSLGIPAGLTVNIYAVVPTSNGDVKVLIDSQKLTNSLAPGATSTVSIDWNQTISIDGSEVKLKSPVQFYFVVDEPTEGKEFGEFTECIEDDNTLATQDINLCPEKVN